MRVHPTRPVGRANAANAAVTATNTKLVLKGTGVAFQNGVPGGLDLRCVQGSVATALTSTFGSASAAGRKALAVEFQTTSRSSERVREMCEKVG